MKNKPIQLLALIFAGSYLSAVFSPSPASETIHREPNPHSATSQPQWRESDTSDIPNAKPIWKSANPEDQIHFSTALSLPELASPTAGLQWTTTTSQESHNTEIFKAKEYAPIWQSRPSQDTSKNSSNASESALADTPPPEKRPAYSRGSLIQIGNTYYPLLGFNALQRHPSSWGNVALVAIDNSFQSRGSATQCQRGDFLSSCADGLAEINVRLWNSKAFSLDLQWTIHSLSGGSIAIGDRTGGTSFGQGQSLGFRLAKNFSNNFGVSFGANRLIHLDETTDLPKNIYLISTGIIRTNPKKTDSPILSLSVGIMTDIYNEATNLGTTSYPSWLLGGIYPSIFADFYDKNRSGRTYYPNVAGVTSPFVCANQSIFVGKPLTAASPECLQRVYFGPVGSIGFAPWPWLGFYAIYEGDLNLGLSLKPIRNVPWTISVQAVQPFSGINTRNDSFIRDIPCEGQNLASCRTRIGLYTDISF